MGVPLSPRRSWLGTAADGRFASQGEALQALQLALERLHRRNGRVAQVTLTELVEEYLVQHEAAPRTIAKLRWLLAKATGAFGDRCVVELRSEEIGAWRATLPEGHRFEATQALRQVLNRAVAWKIIDANPAKAGVDNPRRQHPEKRPFESWAEIEALAEQLGPVYGPMAVFVAATGLRPGERIALERRDLDREARVVYARRAFAHGRLKRPNTRRHHLLAHPIRHRLPASSPPEAIPQCQGNDAVPGHGPTARVLRSREGLAISGSDEQGTYARAAHIAVALRVSAASRLTLTTRLARTRTMRKEWQMSADFGIETHAPEMA